MAAANFERVDTIARVTAALAERSAHCHLLLTPGAAISYVLAAAVDEVLREAYARALVADILNPEGDFPK